MNYYERHLGDYAKDTAHLSMVEHGAYTLLLDRYYATEQPIPADQAHRVARARSKEERAAVDAVLSEFFTLSDGQWISGRCVEEITKAHHRIDSARENGKRGGRPKKPKANPSGSDKKPNGLLVGSESETGSKAHHVPDTTYQVIPSDPDGSGDGEPPPFDPTGDVPSQEDRREVPRDPPPSAKDVVFALGVPLLTAAGCTDKNARSFLAMHCKGGREQAVADALEACAIARPIEPLTWLQAQLKPNTVKASRHAGFDKKDYREGVTEDGSLV